MRNTNITLKRLLIFFILLIFFFAVFSSTRFDRVFEYSTDEGLYLMRAYLYARGHALYKEVWMDHPPLLVIMLSGLFRVFGPHIYLARLLVLAFSAILLSVLYLIISRTQNHLAAAWTVLLAILSSFYIQVSVSAMTTLPSITFAVLSIYGIYLYEQACRKRYLLFSGVSFALALSTRFFVLIFLPAILVEMAVFEKSRQAEENLTMKLVRAYCLWLGAFWAVWFYINFVAISVDFSQLIQPYLKIRDTQVVTGQYVSKWIAGEYDVALLVIGTLIFAGIKQKRFYLIPLISFLTGLIVFYTHYPRWTHHRLYILIPMCWLASFGIYTLYTSLRQEWKGGRRRLSAKVIIMIILVALTAVRIPVKYKRLRQELGWVFPYSSWRVVDVMKKYGKYTHMVVTDRPTFAFYADMPVHPYLASSSLKRVITGLLKASDFLEIIRKDKPELVFFGRFKTIHSAVRPYLQNDYELIYMSPPENESDCPMMLYVLKDVKNKTSR